MSGPKRIAMADYSNRHCNSNLESTKRCKLNDDQNFSLSQCFIKNEIVKIKSKIPKENNSVRTNQHLAEHSYFLPDKNMIIEKRNVKNILNDHNYCLPAKNKCMVLGKCKISQNSIDHNYFLPVSKENHSPTELQENNNDIDAKLLCSQPKATTYSIVPGVRLNSQVFMDNLYHRYYKHSSRNKMIYLVCANQKNKTPFCPVTASISADIKDNRIKTTGQHNHLPRPVDIPMLYLRSAIGYHATQEESMSKSIRQLYNQEKDINPEGAKNYSLLQTQLRVRRMRCLRRRNKKPRF